MVAQPTEKRGFSRVPFNTQVEVRAKGRIIRSQEGINISMIKPTTSVTPLCELCACATGVCALERLAIVSF